MCKGGDEMDFQLKRNCLETNGTLILMRECQWKKMKVLTNRPLYLRTNIPESTILYKVMSGEFFGFLEVDIHFPEDLAKKYADLVSDQKTHF